MEAAQLLASTLFDMLPARQSKRIDLHFSSSKRTKETQKKTQKGERLTLPSAAR
jgi:hypothetical protein